MTNLEKKELTNRIKACNSDQQIVIASVLPTDVLLEELRSRIHSMENIIGGVMDALEQKGAVENEC